MKILIIIIIIFLLLRKNQEDFTYHKICPVSTTLESSLKEHEKVNDNNWDLYIPCGYTGIENEIKKIKVNNPNQVILGIDGCDKWVSKKSLWEILHNKLGKDVKKYIPRGFTTKNMHELNEGRIYILKNSKQRQEGLELSNNLSTIIHKLKNNSFPIVQEYIGNPYLINGHKINMRVYILYVCTPNNKGVYMYNDGIIHYAPMKYIEGSLEFDRNITSGYKSLELYKQLPHFHKQLDSNLLKTLQNNIIKNLQVVFKALSGEVCNNQNLSNNVRAQLFGLDFGINKDLSVFLIEMNKGPNMNSDNDKPGEILKINIQKDILKTLNLENNKNNNFIKILEI